MSQPYYGQPEDNQIPPQPPYNALNFNADNAPVYSTLINIALTSPNYPLPQGSNQYEIHTNQANVSYFNTMNQQTSTIVGLNQAPGFKLPYPQFKTERERIMYRQGMATTSARTIFTGQNPAAPAGVPLSTIYQIINNN